MKKILPLLACLMFLISCGNQPNNHPNDIDTTALQSNLASSTSSTPVSSSTSNSKPKPPLAYADVQFGIGPSAVLATRFFKDGKDEGNFIVASPTKSRIGKYSYTIRACFGHNSSLNKISIETPYMSEVHIQGKLKSLFDNLSVEMSKKYGKPQIYRGLDALEVAPGLSATMQSWITDSIRLDLGLREHEQAGKYQVELWIYEKANAPKTEQTTNGATSTATIPESTENGNVYYAKSGYAFALRKETIEKAIHLLNQGDKDAFDRMIRNDQIHLFKKNAEVYIESQTFSMVQVRAKGTSLKVWTVREAISPNRTY